MAISGPKVSEAGGLKPIGEEVTGFVKVGNGILKGAFTYIKDGNVYNPIDPLDTSNFSDYEVEHLMPERCQMKHMININENRVFVIYKKDSNSLTYCRMITFNDSLVPTFHSEYLMDTNTNYSVPNIVKIDERNVLISRNDPVNINTYQVININLDNTLNTTNTLYSKNASTQSSLVKYKDNIYVNLVYEGNYKFQFVKVEGNVVTILNTSTYNAIKNLNVRSIVTFPKISKIAYITRDDTGGFGYMRTYKFSVNESTYDVTSESYISTGGNDATRGSAINTKENRGVMFWGDNEPNAYRAYLEIVNDDINVVSPTNIGGYQNGYADDSVPVSSLTYDNKANFIFAGTSTINYARNNWIVEDGEAGAIGYGFKIFTSTETYFVVCPIKNNYQLGFKRGSTNSNLIVFNYNTTGNKISNSISLENKIFNENIKVVKG